MTDERYCADPTPEEMADTDFPTHGPTIGDHGRLRDPTDRELEMLDEQRELYRLTNPTEVQKARTRVVYRWLCLSMNGEPPPLPFTKDERKLLQERLKVTP